MPSETVHELLVTIKRSGLHAAQLVQGSMETRRQITPSDGSAAAGVLLSLRVPVPLSNRFWSNTLREVQIICPIFPKQLIGRVEELEVVIDSENVTCAVSIICGQGVKIKEAAVETDHKESEQ